MCKRFSKIKYLFRKTPRPEFHYLFFFGKKIVFCASVPLWLLIALVSAFAQSEIEIILTTNHCQDCHLFNSQKANNNYPKKAPDLFYSGDKFQEKWLIKFLSNPKIIRPAGYITDPDYLKGKPELKSHLRLSKKNALKVSQYLLSLKSGKLETININKGFDRKKLFRAKPLFDRKYGCISCHKAQNLMGLVNGGISGPSLSNAGNRLQGEWIYNFLKNPSLFTNKSRMPIYKISDNENSILTEYLLSQLKENERK